MLTLTWVDATGFRRFHEAMSALGEGRMRIIGNRAINRAGDMSRTQVRRALVKQTGLQRPTVLKAVRVTRSTPETLIYRMDAEGGYVSLKYFDARETRKGVSAKPFGRRKVFAGAFIFGGRFPDRVEIGMGDHVFRRLGKGRLPIEKVRSGVVIPAEMVKGETARAFDTTVRVKLPERMSHEIRRATRGVVT